MGLAAMKLENIEGRMTTDPYTKILQGHLFDIMEGLRVNASNIIIRQGNDSGVRDKNVRLASPISTPNPTKHL